MLQYLQLHTASENLEKAQQAATKAKNEADVCLAENLLLVLFSLCSKKSTD